MKRQKYGDPIHERILSLYTVGVKEPVHIGYMVRRAGSLPPAGPFSTIGEAEQQAEQDRFMERKHNREIGHGVFTP